MGTQKKMWQCLLLLCVLTCPFAYGEKHAKLSNDEVRFHTMQVTLESADKFPSNVFRDGSSAVASKITQPEQSIRLTSTLHYGSAPNERRSGVSAARVIDDNDRRRYAENLMVVMPVAQGSGADTSHSNVQPLYTKTPVVTDIGKNSQSRGQGDVGLAATTSARIVVSEKSEPTPPHKGDVDPHHPYTEFMFQKIAPKSHKSPLQYGYPESFKFVQQPPNELPKNHKPERAAGPPDTNAVRVTSTLAFANGHPFQMFEPVKAIEINKLAPKRPLRIVVAEGVVDERATKRGLSETTETPYRYSKRPVKKAHQYKPNAPKLSEPEPTFTSPPVPSSSATPPPPTTTVTKLMRTVPASSTSSAPKRASVPVADVDEELYNAVRYSTLFAQSKKIFVPAPFASPVEKGNGATGLRQSEPKNASSSAEVPSNTTPATIIAPNFQWTNVSSAGSTGAAGAPTDTHVSKLASLTNVFGENLISDATDKVTETQPPQDPTTKSSILADAATSDLKKMLIALGILKSDTEPSMLELPTTTTPQTPQNFLQNFFAKREPVTPTIDPNSYVSFKKIPIDFEKPREKQPVSDDMKDLLASFGLLPKHEPSLANSILTRVSRQHRVDELDETDSSVADGAAQNTKLANVEVIDALPGPMQGTLENMGLLLAQTYDHQTRRNGHVFQPTVQLEKLSDEQKVLQINDALETIRKLSRSKDTENLSIEELEGRLANVTALLKDENFVRVNDSSSSSSSVHLDDANDDRNRTTPQWTTTTPTESSTPGSAATFTTKSITTTAQTSTTTSTQKSTPASAQTSTTTSTQKSTPTSTETSTTTTTPRISTPTSTQKSTSTSTETSTTTTTPRISTPTSTQTSTTTSTQKSTPTSTQSSTTTSTETSTTSTTSRTSAQTSTPTSTSTMITKTTTDEDDHEFDEYLPTSKKPTSVAHSHVNYLSDESALSFVRFSKNTSTNGNELMNLAMNLPNPLSPEELQHLLVFNKNDVKRQEPNDTTTTAAPTSMETASSPDSSSSESVDSSTRAMESNNAPLPDLADSFGGGETASEGPSVEDLPAARPNGLYFYLDWNTFLNIGGEDDRNPIRIRFSPRAGNARNFMPIRVP